MASRIRMPELWTTLEIDALYFGTAQMALARMIEASPEVQRWEHQLVELDKKEVTLQPSAMLGLPCG